MATQPTTTYTLSGRLHNRQNEPLEGLIVRAYTKGANNKERILGGEARSDGIGRYSISFDIKQPGSSAAPELFIRVYAGNVLLGESEIKPATNLDVQIDLVMEYAVVAGKEGDRSVWGAVRHVSGKPLAGLRVTAVDRDLRREQPLGETRTGHDGKYEIRYSEMQFARAEKERADLVLRVLDEKGATLAESATVFNAPQEANIDLCVDSTDGITSEYEELVQVIVPLLDEISMHDLREQDIPFLAGETGWKVDFIDFLVGAFRLNQKTKIPPEAFYGMFRQGLPGDLDALIAKGSSAHRSALKAALTAQIIPARLEQQLDIILGQLSALEVEQPVFLAKPELLFSRIDDLCGLPQKQTEYISVKLNGYLRQEILKAIGSVSATLQNAIRTKLAGMDYRKYSTMTLPEVARVVALAGWCKDARFSKEIAAAEKRLAAQSAVTVSELLHLGRAVDDNPIFSDDLRRAKITTHARLANLSAAATRQLLERNLRPGDIRRRTLDELVTAGAINETQKVNLLLTLNLGRLTGDNFTLIEKLKGQNLSSSIDLVGWQKSDWQDLLEKEKIPLPKEETTESYARKMALNVDYTYPSPVLVNRVRGTAQKNWHKLIESAAETPELLAFANTYRHLGVADVIRDKTLNLNKKKGAIGARLKLLNTFFDNNPGLDLRWVNLTSKGDAGLNWNNIPEADKPRVKKQVRAMQRVLPLGADADERLRLLGNGYDSAFAIVADTKKKFVAKMGFGGGSGSEMNLVPKMGEAPGDGFEKEPMSNIGMGFAPGRADAIHNAAKGIASGVAVTLGTLIDVGGIDSRINAINLNPKFVNDLRDIDGYDDLFGLQNFCDCEHCRSIFSPAAYFVDLMNFIHRHISEPVFDDGDATQDHPLYLKNRRSDLWTLPLTCENTNGLVPYLTIVNEVLEAYLNKVAPVENMQYDIYEVLATQTHQADNISVNLPFNRYKEELGLYLSHFDTTLFDVYRLSGRADAYLWSSRLGLSQVELDIITSPNPIGVIHRFGNVPLENFYVSDYEPENRRGFINLAGISRAQLDELLVLRFHNLQHVAVDHLFDADEIQNFTEILTGLTPERLDFIHRFLRLWKKTPWSIPELDLILTTLQEANLIDDSLNETLVLTVARLVDIQETLKLKTEEVCGMAGNLPASRELLVHHRLPGKKSDWRLYERLFDLKKLFPPNGWVTNEDSPFLFAAESRAGEIRTPLLLAGLGISEAELQILLELLYAPPYPFDVALDRDLLSLLYRHARLARALKWTVDELAHACRLLFPAGSEPITSLTQIHALIEFREWMQSTPFKIEALRFILQKVESNSFRYKADQPAIGKIVKDIQANVLPEQAGINVVLDFQTRSKTNPGDELNSLKASLSLFFQLTPDQLEKVLTWIETNINALDLQAILNVNIKDGRPDNPDVLTAFQIFLQEIRQYERLVTGLAKYFNLTGNQIINTFEWTDTAANISEIKTALNTSFDGEIPLVPGDLNLLVDLVRGMERTLLLFGSLKFDENATTWLTQHPAALAIANRRELSLSDVKAFVSFKAFLPAGDDAAPFLQELFHPESGYFLVGGTALLERLWLTDINQMNLLIAGQDIDILTTPAIRIMETLWRRLQFCQKLGINGYMLEKLNVERPLNHANWEAASKVALGAFSSRYNEDNVRQEKLEPYQDKINTIKRDALCDYLLARTDLKFKDRNDIYAYFLLDAEMSGCFRTSRIVCALSGLQLYVHRVLMNLEQSASGETPSPEDDPDILKSVLSKLSDTDIETIKQEWEWRKNYRVWEANRKVFLYPENYLEPDLRDNKTPIFKELEDELLQEKVTLDSAEAAYRKYLSQFSELAHLQIAGAYYHNNENEEKGTYYFFGRTASDTPQYYYRKWEGKKVWTPWEKIELAISSDRVSPIIYLGKLYLFWMTVLVQEKTSVLKGNQINVGYLYKFYLNYSCLDEKGKWMSVQKLDFSEIPDIINLDEIVNNLPEDAGVEDLMGAIPEPPKKQIPNLHCFAEIQEGNKMKIVWYAGDDPFWQNFPIGKTISLFHNKIDKEEVTRVPGLRNRFGYLKLNSGIDEDKPDPQSFITGLCVDYEDNDHISEIENYPFIETDRLIADFDGIEKDALLGDDEDVSYVSNNIFSILYIPNKSYNAIFKYKEHCYFIYKIKPSAWFNFWQTRREARRMSTSISDELSEKLFNKGIEGFLSLDTQNSPEHDTGIVFTNTEELIPHPVSQDHIDFAGTYGIYYKELFFHIPFLIANHLNANQKFAEAKWWYERIFDPTAVEPPGENPNYRNWRYIQFRRSTEETMRQILINHEAINQYHKDPFNPHAIARLRLSAYQKAIVMKYIDNLLDWGDALFAQDTMESINEATMLYVLASDILGKRPVSLGKCKTGSDEVLNYSNLSSITENNGNNGSTEFLIVLEAGHDGFAWEVPDDNANPIVQNEVVFGDFQDVDSLNRNDQMRDLLDLNPDPGIDLATQLTTLAFCVPPNENLLSYWDRVEDRLFKIRNCMNISGMRRALSLFAPPIDPMALIRAKAAGLSLEEVMSMLEAPLPPYRFQYLIEKARQFTQTVQSFGSALLSALDRKDAEELTLLRSVHERNILQLSKQIKKQQLDEALAQYKAMVEAGTNVQNRIDYYTYLTNSGLNAWERIEQTSKHFGTNYKIQESNLRNLASLTYLIPQLGSVFALKYGGKELGDSLSAIAGMYGNLAAIAEAVASSAGLEASFQRRKEEWEHQLILATKEKDQIAQQTLAAEIRALIAEKDIEIHDKNIEQARELDDFYKDKFTNLGLYTYLSTTLNRLYREAFNMALEMAKMAERAYKHEREEDTLPYIADANWGPDRAGLLAGERLLLQLQQMEKAYMTQHRRELEITKHISLRQLNPLALITLREEGVCTFEIPEVLFNLDFPGHYMRRIKSVSLSIPCVIGPYGSVNATLSLTSDSISVPVKSIATSNAQNDSGMFELNFRDERYLPFEGAGVASAWNLELMTEPTLRLFDYDTISDVIVHLRYTAREGGDKKAVTDMLIQKINALQLEGEKTGLYTLFSLRHDFPNEWYQMQQGNALEVKLDVTNFPYLAQVNKNAFNILEMTVYTNGNLTPNNGVTISSLNADNAKSVSITFNDPASVKDAYLLVRYTI